jgi:hypothetical protein
MLRAKIPSRGDGDRLQEFARGRQALLARCASSFGIVLEQIQGRIEATTYEHASHYPFPKSFVAPAEFALETIGYAKRVYEKTPT